MIWTEIPRCSERFNHKNILSPGENKINIPLVSIKTSGAKRNLNFHDISKFILFIVRPKNKTSFIVQDIFSN